jgi:hypothetical protein
MTVTHTINTMFILICLYLGGPVVGASDIRGLKQIVIWLLITRVFALIIEVQALLGGYYLKLRCIMATGVWMGHHFSRDTLLNFLPASFGGERLGFGVSGVEEAPARIAVKERDITKRPPLLTRIWVIHQREGIMWHLVLLLVTVALIMFQIRAVANATASMTDDDYWLTLIRSVGYPGLALIENVPYYLTPLIYVAFPPTMLDRRDLMEVDKDGLWKPMDMFKDVKYTKAS